MTNKKRIEAFKKLLELYKGVYEETEKERILNLSFEEVDIEVLKPFYIKALRLSEKIGKDYIYKRVAENIEYFLEENKYIEEGFPDYILNEMDSLSLVLTMELFTSYIDEYIHYSDNKMNTLVLNRIAKDIRRN